MTVRAKMGSDLKQERRHIFLIGFSGSGKSSVGPILAKMTRMRFIDLDRQIARSQGQSIADIFHRRGERYFRTLELQVLESTLSSARGRLVVALGGGAFQSVAIRSLAFQSGTVVYLSCARAEIYRRLKDKTDRPLLNVRPRAGQTIRQARLDRITRMLTARRANYRRADFVISTTDRTPEKVAGLIIKPGGDRT